MRKETPNLNFNAASNVDAKSTPTMLRSLLHNLPGMAYRCGYDSDYTMIFMSEGCKRITGYASSELMGNKVRSFTSLTYQEDVEGIVQKIEEAVRLHQQFILEYRITRKNGELAWLWEQGNAVYNEQGEVLYLDGYIADITSHKQLEAELKQAATHMQELNSAKDRFFSLIAHDLQNPVYAIISLADFLSSNYSNFSPDELLPFVHQINHSAKGIYSLLENLLDWARIQSGNIRTQQEKISLERLIMNVLEHFRPYYTFKSITMEFHPEADLYVYLDARLLNSIFRNLVSNAIKYSHPGTQVEIVLRSVAEGVQVAITDKGIGISKRQMESIFSLDKDERSIGTNQEPGSGLGLVLVKEFCNIIGAEIQVSSKLNHGSTFTLTLPNIVR